MSKESENIRILSKKWFVAHRYKKDPKFTEKELSVINENLTEIERALFLQMDCVDQRHAVEVAKAVSNDPRIQTEDERKILIKAALLHDIGKIKGDFTLTQRVLVKLIKRFFPKTYDKLLAENMPVENMPQGTLANAVFVQATHPRRAAYMLQTFGAPMEVVELIKNHHEVPSSRFARLLHEADALN